MRITLDPRGFLTVELSGPLTVQDFKQSFPTVADHPDFRPAMDVLWDLRQADLARLTGQDVHRVVAVVRESRLECCRVALVFGKASDYGLGRMYQTLAATLPAKVAVYVSLTEAERWLTTPS